MDHEARERLTASPHSLLNRLSSKSFTMGFKKLQEFLCWRVDPKTRGRAKTRAESDLLKAMLAITQVGDKEY
jgi:hypothetical protein